MLTCFSVSNSIGLTATPLYTIEHSGRANNSIVNAVDSMEFYMAGSTSGLGRRPLKAETCVRITYLSPIWPLGQGKVVYLSDRKRWFAYHQRSPYGCLDKGKSPASQAGGGGSYATSNHHYPLRNCSA